MSLIKRSARDVKNSEVQTFLAKLRKRKNPMPNAYLEANGIATGTVDVVLEKQGETTEKKQKR